MNRASRTLAASGRAASCAAAIACLAGASLMQGCRGDRSEEPPRQFFPDMDDSPRWNPQSESEFFADGRTMRPPVEGAVPHARWGYNDARAVAEPVSADRRELLREDPAYFRGRQGDDQFVEQIPVPVTADMILRGQERFGIYCAVCHGYSGDGQGMVGVRWSIPVPSFHAPELKDPQAADGRGTDGYLFHIAMNGVLRPDGSPSMPAYDHALSTSDAWAIVAYIRVLQASHEGTLNDVPADLRDRLLEERRKMPTPSEPTREGLTAPTTPALPEPGTPGMTPPPRTEEPSQTPELPRQNP